MAWTVTNDLRNYLAGTGSLEDAFNGGSSIVRFKTSGGASTLANVPITSAVATTSSVLLTVSSIAAIAAGEAVLAELYATDGSTLMMTAVVGDTSTGEDIHFDETKWNQYDTIDAGNITISLATLDIYIPPP